MSRVHIGKEPTSIDDDLPDAHLFRVKKVPKELVDIVQFLQDGKAPEGLLERRKKILTMKETPYMLINGQLYK